MARFYGNVGYVLPADLVDGVYKPNVVERAYYGDVLNETQTYDFADKVNDDARLSERISIVADAYADENYAHIKYVLKAGLRWSVVSIQITRPRLILSLGGVYNGEIPSSSP